MLRRLLPLVLLVTLAACDGTDFRDLDVSSLSHDPAELVGVWGLVSVTSSGQMGPATTTPVTGASETYEFDADGTARVTRNRGTAETTWEVRRDGLADVPPSLYVGTRQVYFGIDGDRLYFDDRPLDGGLSEYRRQ